MLGKKKRKKSQAKHNVPKSCVQSQGLIWTATHASLINDQLIHAMGMFTQLTNKVFHIFFLQTHQQSVARFLLTNTPTKCCTFPSHKHTNKVFHIFFFQRHTQQPKKVTCAIMAKVKSHLVTLDWQIRRVSPKKFQNCDFSDQKRSHVQSSQNLQH